MLGFGKTRATAEDVAIAILFAAWQVGDDEPLSMLQGRSNLGRPQLKAEMVCLQVYVTTLGIIHTLGDKAALCERVLGTFHIANAILCGFETTLVSDTRGTQVVQALKDQTVAALRAFASAYPNERRLIEEVRRRPPTRDIVSARSEEYSNAFRARGGELQSGIQSVGGAFATAIGAHRDPVVAAAATILAFGQFSATTTALPSYRMR